MSFAPPGSFNQKAYQNSLDDQTHRRSARNPLKPLSFDTPDATDAHKRSRGTDHATIGKQTRTTNTLNVLYKTDGTRYTCAQRTKVLFAFITPHNMCKLTLTRSKLRPDSSIARQSTYRTGEDRCADKHTAQTAQTRERRRLTTPKTHNLPRYSHATAKQTVCTL